MPERYSVLHIVVDDWRTEAAIAYGQHHVKTPNLDGLAASSLVFDRAYCQLARCAPSRHSFMTGRSPQTTRVLTSSPSFRGGHPSSLQWRTLPEHFKLSGWLTIGMGKLFPSNSFYDVPRSWSSKRRYFPYDMQRCPGVADARKLPRFVPPTGTWCALTGSLTQFIDYNLSTEALDALDMIAAERRHNPPVLQPFYLMVGLIRPHGPWMVPAHAWRQYRTADVPIPSAQGTSYPEGAPLVAAHSSTLWVPPQRSNDTGAGELPGGLGNATKVDTSPFERLDATLVREARHAYYASVTWMDEQVSAPS